MAALEKIRSKFGLAVSILIALALLSFIIDPGTLQTAINSMSTKYDVGKIDGKRISYTDFQENVEKFTSINEIISGSSSQNEQTQKNIRNAAWQDMMDKYLFIKNAKAAGIKVGEDEMLSLVSSSNPSAILVQNPIFMDESGNYSEEVLRQFLSMVETDQTGRYRQYWDYLQNTIYTQQFYQKYGALFNASNYTNALQMSHAMASGNTTADVDFCVEYFPMYHDSSIVVTNDEVRRYYKAHKEFFKQQKDSRDMEYVVFEVVPSSDDINNTSLEMSNLYDEFVSTDNMKSFLAKNSDSPLSNYWYKSGELRTINEEIDDQIFGGKDLTQVVKSGDDFFAARTMATKMLPDSVYVKHILLQGVNAATKADSLVNVLKKGENFSNLASMYSLDTGSAADGELGSIGWMTQTYMIPGMESVIEAKVGTPFVLKTTYGTHVVLVTKTSKPMLKKQVAVFKKSALASKETYNKYYAQASRFAAITNGSYDGYKRAVDSLKVYSHNLTITEATSNFGSIDQAKTVTRWVFDNKIGKASSILTVNTNYFFIAAVKGEHKAGYVPVEEATGVISNRLYTQKLQQRTMADVKEKIKGAKTMEEVSERLGVEVEHSEAVSLASNTLDPAMLGAAVTVNDGVVFGPVKGAMGVYVFQTSNRQLGSFYTEDDARLREQQKTQYMGQFILSVMAENAGVEDNRERFY
ncbi:putative uncharacterized protein [Bacteroides sp. CAG:1060]|nr:putative uncharacterized protein [Bacteroides sp. CAG:1060]